MYIRWRQDGKNEKAAKAEVSVALTRAMQWFPEEYAEQKQAFTDWKNALSV